MTKRDHEHQTRKKQWQRFMAGTAPGFRWMVSGTQSHGFSALFQTTGGTPTKSAEGISTSTRHCVLWGAVLKKHRKPLLFRGFRNRGCKHYDDFRLDVEIPLARKQNVYITHRTNAQCSVEPSAAPNVVSVNRFPRSAPIRGQVFKFHFWPGKKRRFSFQVAVAMEAARYSQHQN
jgi:hypothetical protein